MRPEEITAAEKSRSSESKGLSKVMNASQKKTLGAPHES